jgi:uracil-DNA glycosylase family 4
VNADLEEVWEGYRSDPAFESLRREGIRLVPGKGLTSRPLAMLVGEAPGATENLRGEPFVGVSGVLLGRLLEVAGLAWGDVYTTNVVKYRPFRNARPGEDVIMASLPYLRREFAIVAPTALVAVGAVAHSVLGMSSLASRVKGKPGNNRPVSLTSVAGQHFVIRGNVDYWPMLHPSYVLRGGPRMRAVAEEHWANLGKWVRGEE